VCVGLFRLAGDRGIRVRGRRHDREGGVMVDWNRPATRGEMWVGCALWFVAINMIVILIVLAIKEWM
jgi:hypothetical protein